jgi:hypothetical protein
LLKNLRFILSNPLFRNRFHCSIGIKAQANPLSTAALAVRELFGNPVPYSDSWIAQNSLLLAICWPVLLTAIFLPLSVSKYRKLSR